MGPMTRFKLSTIAVAMLLAGMLTSCGEDAERPLDFSDDSQDSTPAVPQEGYSKPVKAKFGEEEYYGKLTEIHVELQDGTVVRCLVNAYDQYDLQSCDWDHPVVDVSSQR